jgi:HD-GYP domain-containing protein (c-di-GMP phosphodiesterase class II)
MAYKNFLSMKNRVQEEVISAVLNILDMHDPYTKGHSKNVAVLSRSIAAEMRYAESECEKIYWAGLVHDIGKILISVGILNKPAKLTVDEYDEIKKHPVYGYEFFNRNQGLKDIAEIVLYHHERYDGRGYPKGLREGEIPVFSRIIAVADAFDAMTNNRSYRRAVSIDEAVAELKKESAKQFDPHIVDIAVRIIHSEVSLNTFS